MSNGISAKDLELILLGLCEQTLTTVYAAFYERDGVQGELPLDVRFVFLEGAGLHIGCASDGESLTIDKNELFPFSMQEDGEVKVHDISSIHNIKKCIGKKMEEAHVVTIDSGLVIGLEIKFALGSSICLLNRGDDLVLSDHFPSYLFDDAVSTVSVFL